jgi:hypothetical protein
VTRARALALALVLAALAPAGVRADDLPACPTGTVRGEAQPATARAVWCERPDSRMREGPFVSWHPGGGVAVRGQYRDGKPTGAWKSWHPTGAQSGEVTFAEGKPNGMLLGWYPNGQASFVGGFRDGAFIGVVETFDPEGRMRSAIDYGADGTSRSQRAWNERNQAIDPASPSAIEQNTRVSQSTPLIDMALTASATGR